VLFLAPVLAITAYGLDLLLAACALVASFVALRLVGAFPRSRAQAGIAAATRRGQ
jgi:hypothetical protein